MRKARQPSPKKQAEYIVSSVSSTLGDLYMRMINHIQFEFTEEMALATLVRPDDLDMVKRSLQLYPHFRRSYFYDDHFEIERPWHFNIHVKYDSQKLSFLPPAYMVGDAQEKDINPAFFEAITPWLDQINPMSELYEATLAAWNGLFELTKGDAARIQVLWPSINSIAQQMGKTMPKLPAPVGIPSPSPALREVLNTAEVFINSAMLMPEAKREKQAISLSLVH